VTRRGALVRSDAVDGLSPAGWDALRAHGVRTIVDLRNEDELAENAGGVETVHIPLDGLDEDPEFWSHWANGPQFGTPLYYGPFLERFPDRIDRVLDAVEHAEPGGVLFHCVGGRDRTGLVAIVLLALAGVPPELIADDYVRGAEKAHTYDPVYDEFLTERGTSARDLVVELATGLELGRPALRDRLIA
jgi:protein-tyrosine phosphatase